jgi:phenylalanyl-tRNA synthetase alpha chain
MNYSQLFQSQVSVSSCLKLRDELMNGQAILGIKAQLAQPGTDKKALGGELNILKKAIQNAADERIQVIQAEQEKDSFVDFDPSFYYSQFSPNSPKNGILHPLTQINDEVVEIFSRLGFDVYDGHQVQTQWNNFSSVGTPDYHPARAMQDTFWLEKKDENGENLVMRTQMTSSLFEYSQKHTAPFRVIFSGVVFRAENIDATHDINFHQFDGWLVDKEVSVSHLLTLLSQFLAEFFGKSIEIRIRPSYFPFTEPSFEIDMFCDWFKGGTWIEIAGAGPIDNGVLKNIGLEGWQGLAFGFGLTRLAQIKLQISGLGQFYNNHLDFLTGC